MDDHVTEQIDSIIEYFEFEEIDEAITEKRYEIGNEFTFGIAHQLRALEELAETNPKELKPYIRRWYIRYKEHSDLENYRESSWDEIWLQFLGSWKKIKHPRGLFLAGISKVAMTEIPEEATEYEDSAIRHTIAVLKQLQLSSLPRAFFISNDSLGKLVDRSREWARHMINGLIEQGILEKAKKHTRRMATEYWYVSLKP